MKKASPSFKKVLEQSKPKVEDDTFIGHYITLITSRTKYGIPLSEIHHAAEHYQYSSFTDKEYFTDIILALDKVYGDFLAERNSKRTKPKQNVTKRQPRRR